MVPVIAGLLCGCSGPSPQDVAAKIAEGKALSADDLEYMITYNAEATEMLTAGYSEAITMADVDSVTARIDRSYPYRHLFSSTLLLNYSSLTPQQTERIDRQQQAIRESFPNR